MLYMQEKWIQVLQIYCKSQRKMTLRKCCSHMKRPVAEHGSKTREEQDYLPSNTHLEGKLSSKYYLRFTRYF